jgi:Ca-activated chloride channel homolog
MSDRRRKPVRGYAAAMGVGLALIVAARTLTWARSPSEPCGHSTTIRVLSSSEKAGLLSEIAAAYETAGHRVEGRCAHVDVVSKSSGEAADALVNGWDESKDGPQPDVWTPVTSLWIEIVANRMSNMDTGNIIPDQVGHVASAPLVIAMPRPMAEATGWPKVQIGWHDLFDLATDPTGWGRFGHPEWGRFKLGKTNPDFSTSGLNALIGEYYAATGSTSDLTLSSMRDGKVERFVKGVESSVVHYGDISATFLENLQRADEEGSGLSYVAAVAIEEKSVWDYNHGNPSGNPDTIGDHAAPSVPLVAVYPKEGTLVNDHPYAILNAPWVSPIQRKVAQDFLRFVQSPEQQSRFQDAGFRDYKGAPGKQAVPGNGLLAQQPALTLPTPSAQVLDAIQSSWERLRKRARVLLVLDVSGSMGALVSSSGTTKMEEAKGAALAAMDQFRPDDEVGLWVFSSDMDRGLPYAQLSPVSALGPKEDALRKQIRSLTPEGGTGLYATVAEATRSMRASFDPSRINGIVVMTDGVNDYGAYTSVGPLVGLLRNEPPDRAVRVFCIAYGADADIDTLRQISDTSMGATYDASNPSTIDDVFAAVISNF